MKGLRVFVAVVEEQSFSGAGRRLGVTQPAVSNHLHALEERFGVELLRRGRPPRPTAAGEVLLRRARSILEEAAALEDEMARRAEPGGSLVVGASSTPAEFLMPGVIAGFSARFPEVSVELKVYDSEDAVRALLEREVEAAVVGYEVDDSRLACRVIEEETLQAILPAKEAPERAELGEVSSRPLVLRERGSATRRATERGLSEAGISPKVAMELGSNGAVAGAVSAGVGVGFLPEHLVSTHPGVRGFPVEGLVIRRPFALVTERGRRLSPAATAFIEACLGKVNE